MSEQEELVAKALYETPDEGYAWTLNADDKTQTEYREKASAALEALWDGAEERVIENLKVRFPELHHPMVQRQAARELVEAVLGERPSSRKDES